MTNEILKNRIHSLIKEHNLYVEHFEKEKEATDSKKEEITKSLKEGTEFAEVEKELEFLLFGFQMKLTDINILTSELTSLYSIAKQAELDLELPEEKIAALNKMLENKKKLTFIPEEKGLVERVKGVQEQYLQNVVNSPQYQTIKKQLLNNL